ncbi:MAG: ABC transporter substrate-binding protein [Acidimicrobiia bacterium]|nr:ABC transporter substrate-binding protein [Acidimicrobiia bacterium]
MRKRYSWLIFVFVLALVAAACSSSTEDTTTTGAPEATTTTAGEVEETTSTTEAPPAEMIGGRGIDLENKIITIGLLSDLTGAFAGLTTHITDAQRVYWDQLNAAGGIDGWTINAVVEDTAYDVPQHLEKLEKLRDQVAMISLSTGSPPTVASLPILIEDQIPTIPLSWYSGWAIPDFDHDVTLEQNTNYCLESMNLVAFAMEMGATKFALAGFPGDYGGDAAEGVRKAVEYYGLELVYDGEAAVIPGQDQTEVIQAIVNSGADWTILTTNPGTAAELVAGAVGAGYTGMFTGNGPTYNAALLDSPAAPLFDSVYYQSSYNVGWGVDTPGNNLMMAAMTEALPDARPSDAYIIGWNEGVVVHQVLAAAIAAGDLSPEGILTAMNSLEDVDFGGSQPNQSWAGTPNEYVLRSLAIFKPDLAAYTAAGGADQTLSQEGGTTGSVLVKDFFISDAAADFDFTAPCWEA